MNPIARYVLRAALSGIAAANASLLTVLTAGNAVGLNELMIAGGLGLSTALAYAGIGAAVPQVEPHVVNKMEDEG